jgi:hypothetical protein
MRYYIIRDEEGRMIFIHKVWDSVQTCFITLCMSSAFCGDILELVSIETDEYGKVEIDAVMYTFVKGDTISTGICK